MPAYTYVCEAHGGFEHRQSIHLDIPATKECPACGETSNRSFQADLALGVHYNCQGFHNTDNYKGNNGRGTADKLEILNTQWSRHFNEPPPPPSTSVPKNSREKY